MANMRAGLDHYHRRNYYRCVPHFLSKMLDYSSGVPLAFRQAAYAANKHDAL